MRFSPLQKALDFFRPDIEDEKWGMEACEQYCLKSGPAIWCKGASVSTDENMRRVAMAENAPTAGAQGVRTRKNELRECFDKYDKPSDFRREHPEVFARNCSGIMAVYASRLREKQCDMPTIYWYFGATRSGKTF